MIRVREIGRGEVGATQLHNSREYDEKGLETPENIDKTRKNNNHEWFYTGNNLTEAINNRLQEAGVKERKNSVVAIEIVVSASKDFWELHSETAFFVNSHKFLNEKYGKENVVAYNEHYDESNPHCHFIVTPIVEKEVKWKNENGQGVKKGLQLSARDLTGTKKHLIALQDDFFNLLDKKYNQRLPEKNQFVRGKSAKEQNKIYTKSTSVELGVLRDNVREIRESIEFTKKNALDGLISLENAKMIIEDKLENLDSKISSVERLESKIEKIKETTEKIEKRQEENSKDGKWQKGQFENLTPPKPKQRGMEM